MKLSLTITDASASELSNILAQLGANGVNVATTVTAPQMPQPPYTPAVPDGEDDDTGPVNASAPDLDKDGLPWDERIHSANKGTNKDGTWRKKRGVSDDLVSQVEAELKGRSAPPMPSNPELQAPAAPAAAPRVPQFTPPTNNIPMPSSPEPQAPAAPAPSAPAAPAMPANPEPVATPPAPAAPAAAPAPSGELDFHGFMQHLAGQMGTGKITHDDLGKWIGEIAAWSGQTVNAITDVQNIGNGIQYAVWLANRDGKW